MNRLAWTAAWSGLLALALGGCPTSSNNNNAGALTTAEKAAVKLVVEQVVAAAAIVGTLAPLGDSRLDLDSLNILGAFGECPRVSYASTGETAIMQFDFTDAGCRGPSTANEIVTGDVNIDVELNTREASIAFQQVRIAGNAISATFTGITIGEETDGTQLEGTCDLATDDVGDFGGRIDVRLSAAGQVNFADADVELGDGNTTYDVELTDVRADPLSNANFIPERGSVTFTIQEGGTAVAIEVTFTASSPDDGAVGVEVGSASAVDYTVPGLVSLN